MRWSVVLCAIGLALVGCAEPEQVQTPDRLNQMIPLIEQGLRTKLPKSPRSRWMTSRRRPGFTARPSRLRWSTPWTMSRTIYGKTVSGR